MQNKIGEMIREKINDGDGWTGRYTFEGRTELGWLNTFTVKYKAHRKPDIFRRLIIKAGRTEVGYMWPSHADEVGRETYDMMLSNKLGTMLVRAYEVTPGLFALYLIPEAEG